MTGDGQGNDPFFAFRAFDDEIGRKLASLGADRLELARRFVDDLRRAGLPARDLSRVEALLDCLARLDFDRLYPNYLTHPIRVAASLVRVSGRAVYAEVALALCHNIREAGFADLGGRAAEYLDPATRSAIDLLTIDRARERDEAYLTEYYDRIEYGPEPLLLLKGLDKLDNCLWSVCFDPDPREARVLDEQVCPRLFRREPVLADYLLRLAAHVRDSATRARFAARAAETL